MSPEEQHIKVVLWPPHENAYMACIPTSTSTHTYTWKSGRREDRETNKPYSHIMTVQRGLYDHNQTEQLSKWSWAPSRVGLSPCESAAHPKEKRKAVHLELAVKGASQRSCVWQKLKAGRSRARGFIAEKREGSDLP